MINRDKARVYTENNEKGVNMCGIAGAAGIPDTNEEIKRMLAALGHRGPDACGIYQAKGPEYRKYPA